jgi:hypothetical protein
MKSGEEREEIDKANQSINHPIGTKGDGRWWPGLWVCGSVGLWVCGLWGSGSVVCGGVKKRDNDNNNNVLIFSFLSFFHSHSFLFWTWISNQLCQSIQGYNVFEVEA